MVYSVNDLMSSGTSNIVVNLKNDGFGTEATTSQSNLERLQFVSDMFGGDMQNVNLYGASNGSHAVISMAAVLKDNPNIDIKNVMAIDYGLAGQTNEQFIKDLASSGTNLILGTDSSREDGYGGCRRYGKIVSENGGTAVIIEYPSGYSHDSKCHYFIEDNILDFVTGNGDFGNSDRTFKMYKFVDGVEQEVELTQEEILKLIIPYVSYGDNYNIRLSREDMEKLSSGGSLGTVASNVITVMDGINSICSSMNESYAVLSPLRQEYESTTAVPSGLSSAQDVFLGISSDLLTSLDRELSLVSSIAQTYYDMDNALSQSAGQLSGGNSINIDKTLLDIANTDITFDTTFNKSFYFDISSTIIGKTGKVNINDLNSMVSGDKLSGVLHENFESERESANETKTSIEDFKNKILSKTELQGEAWNKVSEKFAKYSELMDLRVQSADKLEESMAQAVNLIRNYMGDYSELDDSKLPELKEAVANLEKEIAEKTKIVNATKIVDDFDSKGRKIGSHTEYVYSGGVRAAAMQFISQAKEQIVVFNKLIAKIEGLPEIIRRAEDLVNQSLNEIYASYGMQVSNVVTGNPSSFTSQPYTPYVHQEIKEYQEVPEEKRDFDLKWFFTQGQYGSHDDYLNGVQRIYDPLYNKEIEDNGKSYDFGDSLEIKNVDDIINTKDGVKHQGYREIVNKPFGPNGVNKLDNSSTRIINNLKEEKPSTNTSNATTNTNNSSNKGSSKGGYSGGYAGNSGGGNSTPSKSPSKEPETKPSDEVKDTETGNGEKKQDTIITEPTTDNKDELKPITPIRTGSKPNNSNNYYNSSNITQTTNNDDSINSPVTVEPEDSVTPDEPIIDEDVNLNEDPIVYEKPNVSPGTTDDIIKDLPNNKPETKSNDNSVAKTIGVLTGVGAAVGAAAYGAHKYIKSKEETEERTYSDDEY